MYLFFLASIVGIILALFCFQSAYIIGLIALALLAISTLFFKQRYTSVMLFAVIAYVVCAQACFKQWQQYASTSSVHRVLTIQGRIASIPKPSKLSVRFLFQAKKRYSISWYGKTPKLQLGQRWRLTVKVKPLHFMQNPQDGALKWRILASRYQATAYVLNKKPQVLLAKSHYFMATLREHISAIIWHALGEGAIAGIIVALSVGSRAYLTQSIWHVFQLTGTSHLVAISGLHVGLIAVVIFFLAKFLWRQSVWCCQKISAVRFAAVITVFAVIFYGVLAGWSTPTERAVIMISCVMLSQLLYWNMSLLQRLALAFTVVLLFSPLSILTASFWLSFSAVFWIAYGFIGYRKKSHAWKNWWRLQLVITLGLMPITLWFFHKISLVSVVTNAFAIPWVSLIIVPLCFLGSITSTLSIKYSGYIFKLAGFSLRPLWYGLSWFAAQAWVYKWCYLFSPLAFGLFVIAALWLLAPKGVLARYLAVLLIVPSFFLKTVQLKKNQFRLTVLDVGQGLACVIETRHHVMVYDAGPHYPGGFDAGARVLVPYLYYRHHAKLNMLMVSHGDNDHIGGAPSLLKQFLASKVLTSVPKRFKRAQYCHAGQHWRWDGVQFNVLYPIHTHPYLGNNSSCVLQIRAGKQRALLTGDIEKPAELKLISKLNKVNVLVAAHHGSKTSSSLFFLHKVRPDIAIFSTGYLNRFHFPSTEVVARFESMGVKLYNSAVDGALTVTVGPTKTLVQCAVN